MSDLPHIFISYARKDGRELALRLHDDLLKHNYDVWLDTAEIEGGASWSHEIEAAIDRCNVALALLSKGSYLSEICRAEQLRSLRRDKRVIPLLVQANSDRPLYLEHLNFRDFSEASQYATMLQTLLGDIKGGETRPLPAKHLTTFNNAPPLPPTFVNRPDEFERLRQAIVGDGGNRQIALTALRGMGGSGKSVLAAALCWDEVVQAAFPDGIFWVEIGREARELVPRMAQIAAHLGDDPKLYSTLETSQDNLRNLLRSKAALIVLDDVWDAKMIDPFKANAPRCRILFITRDGTIAQQHDAQEIHLGVMTPAESLEFLRSRAGRDDPRLAEIAEHLGHLPLAIKLAGAHLSEGMSTTEWLTDYQHVAQIRLGRRSTDPHENLQVCFDLSVERLAEADRPLYFALGIFAQDVAIPSSVIQLLWRKLAQGLTDHDCSELLTELDRLELLERHPDNTITLHDLLQDYCHATLADQVVATHAALLAAYNPQAQAWSTIPHDGYLYHHLIYHLIEAGRQEEAQRLLLDYGWLHAKLNATEANALVNDYVFLTTNLHRASPLCLIRDAIRLSTHILNRFPSQLAAQLIGRLQSWDLPEVQQILAQTEQAQTTPWLHPLCGSLTSPGSALVRTLVGHQGAINAVAVLADSSRLISGSEDNTLKIWDSTNGIELRTLTGHNAEIVAVAAWSNGKLVASGDYNGVIIVWDIETGAVLWSASVDADSLTGLAVLPDSRSLISASSDGKLMRWDLESGTQPYILAEELGGDNQLALLPDGQGVVTISSDAPITVWDVNTGSIVLQLGEDTTETLGTLAIVPDGRRMISTHGDDPVRVWNLETGEEIRSLTGHRLSVNQVAVTVDGRRAIAAVEDGTLIVWNLDTGEQEASLAGHVGEILAVAVTPDGRYAISGAMDRTLKVWDLSSTVESNLTTIHDGELSYVSIMPDEQHALSIAFERYISKVTVIEGASLQLPTVTAVSIFPDWERYITTRYPHSMKIWRLDDGAEVEHVVRPIGDNEQDNLLSVQDLWSGEELLTLQGHTGSVTTIAIMTDGKRALSGSNDATLRLWDLSTGENLRTITTAAREIMATAIMPDNRRAIVTAQDGTLRVWDLDEGTELYILTGHTGWVSDVVVTADGQYAISGSFDGTVRVWDLSKRQEIGMLSVDIGIVSTIAMTVDEGFLLAGTYDGTLWVWDLQQGKLVANFSCEGPIVACDMGAMSQTIVVGEQSGRLHFLRFENV